MNSLDNNKEIMPADHSAADEVREDGKAPLAKAVAEESVNDAAIDGASLETEAKARTSDGATQNSLPTSDEEGEGDAPEGAHSLTDDHASEEDDGRNASDDEGREGDGFSLRRFFRSLVGRNEPSQPVEEEPEPIVDSTRGRREDFTPKPVEENPTIAQQVDRLKNIKTEKQALLDAIDSWQRSLADAMEEGVSTQVVELSAAHPTGLAQLYSGRPTKLSSLVREPRALAHCQARARELMAQMRQMEERHGIGPAYLAVGTVSWTETEGGAAPEEDQEVQRDLESLMASRPAAYKHSGPALLASVAMTEDDEDTVLVLERSVKLWPELERAMDRHGLSDRIEAIVEAAQTERGFSPTESLAPLDEAAQGVLAGFDLYESLTVGQYIHPGNTVAEDLAHIKALVEGGSLQAANKKAYALLCALTGEESAAENPLVKAVLPRPVEYDRDPEKEHGVGDLDPDQHNALDAVASGAHVLLDAPPGSERLATVAAMVVDCALDGKTIAYIPGERDKSRQLLAALSDMDLSALTIDLSNPASWQEQAMGQLRATLNETAPQGSLSHRDIHAMRSQLTAVRSDLKKYFDSLHNPNNCWGVSVYDALHVLTDLTSMKPGPKTRVRLGRDVVSALAEDGAQYARQLLARAESCGIFSDTGSVQPWLDLVITDPSHVSGIISTIRDISIQILPQVRANIVRTSRETGLVEAASIDEWIDQLEMLQDVRSSLDTFLPDVFEQSAADMVIATALPAWRKERSLHMRASTRRRLIKQAKEMVRPGVHVDDLHAELVRIQEQRHIWREYSQAGGYPVLPTGMDQMIIVARQLTDALQRIQDVVPPERGQLMTMPVNDLVRMMDALASDEEGAEALPNRVGVLADLRHAGLDELVDDLRKRRVSTSMIPAELDLAWWSSAFAYTLSADPLLSRLDGEQVRALTAQLRDLDRQQVESLAPQALSAFKSLQRDAIDLDPQGASFLLHEAGSDSALTLPELYRRCELASLLRPIRIIPPVLVPHICDISRQIDVAVLDGIESMNIAELVSVVARARQVVVVGDMRRDRDGALKDFAALLPHMTIPPTRLRLHEQVTKFLAEHGYGDDVMAVPVPRATSTMNLEVVDGRGAQAPGATAIESSAEEAQRVVDLVLRSAAEHPDESLAVVALNARHATRIREMLILAQAKTDVDASFFESTRTEPFVVVEASNCAGIRRDRVIIACGYAKTPHGRMIHDFGDLSSQQGPSILVDALSTVRKDVTIVSSFAPEDVDRDRLKDDAGALMLVDLLDCAGSDHDIFRVVDASRLSTEEENEPDRLLVDLARRLFKLGLPVVANVGTPLGMTIPLAIGHPEFPEEMLLAVLTDNPDYVAEKSLRRRERHWRSRLEDYGWHVHTVYSMSVFTDPQGEAQRIVDIILDIIDERKGIVRPPRHDAEDPAGTGNAGMDEAAAEGSQEGGGQTVVQGEGDAAPLGAAPEEVPLPPALELPDEGEVEEAEPPAEPAAEPVAKRAAELSRITGDFANIVGAPTKPAPPDVYEAAAQELRPPIASGLPLAAYTDDQLDDLIEWISQCKSTTDYDVLVEELTRELALPENTEQTDLVLRRSVLRFLNGM